MKFKFLLILAAVILLTLGAVSAQDNATEDSLADSSSQINVTFDEEMWQEDLGDIDVELPEDSVGNFSVKIDDEVIYNQIITNKTFKVPVKLPKRNNELYIAIYPPIDCRNYKVSAFLNGIDLNINKTLKVMKYPPDYNTLYFPEEILQNDEYFGLLAFPRSADGEVEFYIDEKLFEKTTAKPTIYWQDNPFSKLALGNHTFRVIYYGDSYYRSFNRTFNFTVVNVMISIPSMVNISHDDCISVRTHENANGNVKVYIDDKLISDSVTEHGEFIMSLEGYLSYRNREVKVVFSNKDFTRIKTSPVVMTYDFDVYLPNFSYGEENVIDIMLPDSLNNNLLTVSINGTVYSFKRAKNIVNNDIEVDVSRLSAGNYTLTVDYKGDDKFYSLKKSYNFTIGYYIHAPYDVEYKDSSKVYLKLPFDADGDLIVYIDGAYFNSAKITKGYGEVKINSLAPGDHELRAEYSGNDYDVDELISTVYAIPKISLTYRFTAGEDKYITVEVPPSSKGYVVFNIDDKDYKINVKNGIAKFSLKNLKVGVHDVYVSYYGENGEEDELNWRVVTVYKPKVKFLTAQSSFKGVNVKIKLLTKNGKALAGKSVTVKFKGKTYKLKTNSKGILTFKKSLKLKNRKYTLTITYLGYKLTKKLKVMPVALMVSKSKKKLTVIAEINKKAKDKPVVVKINSKKYSLKTNRNGIAKLTIKKLKTVKSVSATYLKSTVRV